LEKGFPATEVDIAAVGYEERVRVIMGQTQQEQK